MENNDNNADRTPRVVLGRAVPAGATVAYRVGDDGWDGWEIDVLEDPAAVLASDELVAVLDEPEPSPWPSAPLNRREDVEAWLRERGGGVMDPVEPAPEVGAIICALRAMPTRSDVDEWTVQRAADLLLEFGTRPL